MSDDGLEGYRGDLNNRCVTIAEALKPVGYRTYMSGKWHISQHTDPDGPKHSWPRQRGFDRYFGIITGAAQLLEAEHTDPAITSIFRMTNCPKAFSWTDAISDEASAFIRDHAEEAPDQPFFTYVAYTSPHWPLHAHDEDIATL